MQIKFIRFDIRYENMKNVFAKIFFLFAVFSSNVVFSQYSVTTTPVIIPANPTTEDSIKANYNIYLSSQPATQLSLTIVNTTGSLVTAQEHYGAGMLLTTTVVAKITDIGKLPAGD